MPKRKETKLVLSDIKILVTIEELNRINRYPTSVGVFKILSGSQEGEYLQYEEILTYNTLTSLSPKQISRKISFLIRHEFIQKIYHPSSLEEYLQITDRGSRALNDFFQTHKSTFKRKVITKKIEIIEIR